MTLAGSDLSADRDRWPQVALVAGLAVCDTLATVVNPCSASLKWPNDVYVEGGKVAGILIETAGDSDRLVVGIGVNVATDIGKGPKDLQGRAKSLSEVIGEEMATMLILPEIVDCFQKRMALWRNQPESLTADFGDVCLLTGRTVTVRVGERMIQGRCLGIDSCGDLQVDQGGKVVAVRSGEVVQWSDVKEE